MSFFDSGLVNFIKLLIIVGLISMLYMIMMQKIKEQNHKISSLLSLVTTMAHEITVLKNEPSEQLNEQCDVLEEKNEISDDETDSDDSDSDSDESIDLDEIDLVKGDKITMMETVELPEVLDLLESMVEDPESKPEKIISIKKMNISQLIDLVISKNLKSKTEANKMKKKDLLELLEV